MAVIPIHPEDDLTPEEQQRLKILGICREVANELFRAKKLHPSKFHSPHEADSTIREEYEEFWDEVKAFNLPKGRDTRPAMRVELIQLAAMAVRAILEVTDADGLVESLSGKDA